MTERALPQVDQDLLKFIRDAPLYVPHQINAVHLAQLEGEVEGTLDLFCPACGSSTVFKIHRSSTSMITRALERRETSAEKLEQEVFAWPRVFTIDLHCSRDRKHRGCAVFLIDVNRTLQKVGQYPSVVQRSTPELKKYRSKLDKQDYEELNRAVGLAAHGVGIGSFVYLRRIFERQLHRAAQRRQVEEPPWSIEDWRAKRVEEKIEDLHGVLPDILVKNRTVYAILSKGIHELSETECEEYFIAVRAVVELILDEEVARQEKAEKEKATLEAISKIRQKLSSSGTAT